MGRIYKIALMPGDGIGPEVVNEAIRVLAAVQQECGFQLNYVQASAGDKTKQETGFAVPPETVNIFRECDAALKGPFGESVYDFVTGLRFQFDLYANLRPAVSYPMICPPALRPDINLVVVRENSEGLYRSLENEIIPGVWTVAGVYTKTGCERIAKYSFETCMRRLQQGIGKRKLAVADKSNVMRNTHGLFRRSFLEVHKDYPEIELTTYYADAMCAHLVRHPQDFDVVVSENLLADLLSDLAGQVAGGLGMTAGSNINPDSGKGLFEPTHGCAPDIVGTGKANPIGQIRSVELMLQFLGEVHSDESCLRGAELIEKAIGYLFTKAIHDELPVEVGGKATTSQVGERVASYI